MSCCCLIVDVNPSLLDPPEHLFRIRLVCVLLETCGQYFDRGSSKRKLDCFLVYFQVRHAYCCRFFAFTCVFRCDMETWIT